MLDDLLCEFVDHVLDPSALNPATVATPVLIKSRRDKALFIRVTPYLFDRSLKDVQLPAILNLLMYLPTLYHSIEILGK
jgi:hypothetical protein